MSNENNEPTPKGRSVRKDLSMFGGARSLVGNAAKNGAVIGTGIRAIAHATKKSMEPGRVESFGQALSRLGVTLEELPVIHNQLILQLYLTFFVGVTSLASCVNLVIQGSVFAAVIAFLIGIASFTKAGQSSIQCESIRQRKLGVASVWLATPAVWFPNRMPGMVIMSPGDPARHPNVVNKIVVNARRNYLLSGAMFALFVGSFFLFDSWGWPLLALSVSAAMLIKGAGLAFEVYKRRKGVICDLYPWLIDTSAWVPAIIVPGGAVKTRKAANDDSASAPAVPATSQNIGESGGAADPSSASPGGAD